MATIVIIEDHPASREFLVDLLRSKSHHVLEAADGREGLEVVRLEHPDLVFTDVLMPTMDGFEFARRVREDPAIASTPLIFYTASYHSPEAERLAASCGVARFLTKPSAAKDILAAVDEILAGRGFATATPPSEDFDRQHVRLVTDKLAHNVSELQLTTNRLDALVKLGVELSSQREPVRLLDRLCAGARELIGSRHACVAVLDDADETKVRHHATSGLAAESVSRLKPQPVQDGIVGRIVREATALRIADRSMDARSLGLPDGFPSPRSLLAVPIASGAKVYGCLCLTDRLGLAEFTENDEDIARALGAASAVAYESLLRYEALERSARRLELLHEIDRAILGARSPEAIADVCVARISRLIPCERASVLELDTAAERATVLARSPAEGPGFRTGESFALEIFGDVSAIIEDLRQGKIHLLDLAKAKGPESEAMRAFGFRHYVVVPLIATGSLMGALTLRVEHPDTLSAEQRQIALEVSAQMAIAIQMTAQRQRIQHAEERYHSLYDRVPVGIFRSSPDGRIVEVNPAHVEILGFADAEQLKQINAAELYADPAERRRLIEVLNREGIARNFEARLRRRDGTEIWCDVSARVVRDAQGQILYHEGVIQDVSERKRAQHDREERERLALFAAEIGAAVTEVDDLGPMLHRCAEIMVDRLGAAFARIWTLNEGEDALELQASAGMYTHIDGPHSRVPLGTTTIGWIAAKRRPHLTNSVIGDPRVDDQEWAKRERMVAFAGYPLLSRERLLGVMAMFSRQPLSAATRDALGAVARGVALGIETRKRAVALSEALRWAKESDRLKTAFLANMSHEIRTPLNSILGYAEILRSELGTDEEEAHRPLFDGIKRGSDRLLNTIHSILDVARLEAGTFRYEPAPVRLRELVEKVSEPFDALARNKGLAFRLDLQEPAATVRFDPYCLSQTLRHLLDNAVKFTTAGGVTVRLRRADDRHLVLEVEDTGTGIEDAFRSRLFETFSQEDSGYTRPYEGAGLGLALSKRYLSLGNARIAVSSRKGTGTAVAVHFESASEVVD